MTDDEQEALSVKYNVCRIVRLTSGNFALFMPFSNDEGLPLEHIGPIEEIVSKILSAEQVECYHAKWRSREAARQVEASRPRPSRPKSSTSPTSLDDLV